MIIPVEISAYEDRSFSFILKTSPALILFKKVVNINKGSSQPNKIIIAHVINFQLEEITNIKIQYLNIKNLITAKKLLRVLLKIRLLRVSMIKKVLAEVPEKTSYGNLYSSIYKCSVITVVVFVTAYNWLYGKGS